MRRAITAALIVTVAIVLTACDDDRQPYDPIKSGIICSEAGGSWTWSDWTGYHCEFEAKP